MQKILGTSLTSFQRVISLKGLLAASTQRYITKNQTFAGHHEDFKELIMAHWSPSPGAHNPGIKLFIFKCQSSREQVQPLPPWNLGLTLV